MSKIFMIDQKHRRPKNWLLGVPAWLFVAMVMAITLVGFINQASAANLVNYDFSVKQTGTGNSTCYPGPTCSDVHGWVRLYNKASGYFDADVGYLLINVDSVQPGGYLGVVYRYWQPVSRLNNAIKYKGGCSAPGAYFMIDMHDVNNKFLGRQKVSYLPRIYQTTPLQNHPVVLTPFTSPAGTVKVKIYLINDAKSYCIVDNIYLN